MNDLEPVPAATVALIRESARRDDLEVLLLQRNQRLVFLGGHWVFPGGRIDAADFAACGSDLEYPAARLAAVRETREEAGIDLDPEALIHTAHWTTPPRLPRRFSTWFFVCPLRAEVAVRVDKREILDYQWLSPRDALKAAAARRLDLARPTAATLADLRAHRDLSSLVAACRRDRVRVFPQDSRHYRPLEMGYSDA